VTGEIDEAVRLGGVAREDRAVEGAPRREPPGPPHPVHDHRVDEGGQHHLLGGSGLRVEGEGCRVEG